MTDCLVVIPCYNEEARLDRRAFLRFDDEAPPEIRLLFVDDGSTDSTAELLEQMVAASPTRLELLRLPGNRGKAEAVRLGMLEVLRRGPTFAGYWDADLATPLHLIPLFRERLVHEPSIDLLLGSRVNLLGRRVRRAPLRHYSGRFFATVASLVLQLPVYDTQCGAKMLRVNERTSTLFEKPFFTRWIFDVEIVGRLLQLYRSRGDEEFRRLYEYPVTLWTDVAGSHIQLLDVWTGTLELLRLYRAELRHLPPRPPDPAPEEWPFPR
ncbi:MAG: glycosyltransferase [Armatimonadetes bacterium]|nr:glycosyltransferase [Armatimonadota bacterium]